MLWWVWWIIELIVSLILGELLRPKPKFGQPQPSALGDFQVPTAEEGRPIPIVFGTCHAKGPNVVWYGDLAVVALTKKVKTGLFSSSRVTTGYTYFMGQQLVICHGKIDNLIEIRFADKKPHQTNVSNADGLTVTVDDVALFGGPDQEGGVQGKVDMYYGTSTQIGNAYMSAFLGAAVPGYRRLSYAVLNAFYLGNSKYLKNISFVVDRCPNQLGLTGNKHQIAPPTATTFVGVGNGTITATGYSGGALTDSFSFYAISSTNFVVMSDERGYLGTAVVGTAFLHVIANLNATITAGSSAFTAGDTFRVLRIFNDANPACMLYEILTDVVWGCGISTGAIDTASFQAVGNTLYTEGFGLSMLIESQSDAESFMGDILRHIDGVIYTDPSTGLITIKLARADYTVSALPIFNQSNVSSCSFARASWGDTSNVAKVTYTDRSANYLQRIAQAQDLANIQAKGGDIDSQTIQFLGISNAATANQKAATVLKTISYPLAVLELQMNREGYPLRPGSVFRFTWPDYGITDMVVRATRINYGQLQDGKIRVSGVEDIFAIAATAYTSPPPSTWIAPNFSAVDISTVRILETPYYVMVNALSASAIGALQGNESYALIMAQRPASQDIGINVYSSTTNVLSNFSLLGKDIFTPTAQLNGAITWNATTLNINNVVGDASSIVAGGFALVDNEWITLETVSLSTGVITAKRGVFDSVPAAHSSGAPLWVYSGEQGFGSLETPYTKAQLIYYRETATSVMGESALSSAPQQSYTHTAAWTLPYPPADVKIDGSYFPTLIRGNFVLTWSGRNRLTETTAPVAWTAAHVVPETNTTYTLRVYDASTNALLNEYTGLVTAPAGGSYTYRGGGNATSYKITLFAVRSGLQSAQQFIHTANVYGYGLDYDKTYGGTTAGIILPRGTSSISTGDQYTYVPDATWINGSWHDIANATPYFSNDNGTTWVAECMPLDSPPSFFGTQSYIYGDGYYVILSNALAASFWYRRDGGPWKAVGVSSIYSGGGGITSITFDGLSFIFNINSGQQIYTTADLQTWTQKGSSPNGLSTLVSAANFILKVGSQYVALGGIYDPSSGTVIAYPCTSSDLVSWTRGSAIPAETGNFALSGVYFNGAYFSFGTAGDKDVWNGTLSIYRSTDLVSWAPASFSPGVSTPFHGAHVFDAKLEVIGGERIFTTTDNTSWSSAQSAWDVFEHTGYKTFRGKGCRWSTENGPTKLLLNIPYYSENGGKIVSITSLTNSSTTLEYPSGAINGNRFGIIDGTFITGNVIAPFFDDSGFHSANSKLLHAASQSGGVRAVRNAGKLYFEITVALLSGGASSSEALFHAGIAAASYGLWPQRVGLEALIWANGIEYNPIVGDVIGVLSDFAAKRVTIMVNNSAVKTVNNIDTSMLWMPVVDTTAATLDLNLGQHTFIYAQSGFSSWT